MPPSSLGDAAAGAAGAGAPNAVVEIATVAAHESSSATILVVIVIPLKTVRAVCPPLSTSTLRDRGNPQSRSLERCNPIAQDLQAVVLPHFGALNIFASRLGN